MFIPYFTDGPEKIASLATAKSIKQALGAQAVLLPLTRHNWEEELLSVDAGAKVILATHGSIGEDGTIQSFLEANKIPFTHSSSAACLVMSDKHLAKLQYLQLKIPTPNWCVSGVPYGECNAGSPNIFIQKPRDGGSKNGLKKISSHQRSIMQSDNVIVEDYIDGTYEVSIVVLRTIKSYAALTPIVRKRTSKLGVLEETDKIIPRSICNTCIDYSIKFNQSVSARGVTKTDFIIDISGKAWALETDAIPGLSMDNATVRAARSSGISYHSLIKILLKGAL